jgi:peptide/nickel transport system substrate-binding protein
MVPVAHGGSGVAYKATVVGAHTGPLGNEKMAVMNVPGQDNFVWMQNAEPLSLYCSDEDDGETLRACEQIFESLLSFKTGGVAVEPGLAGMPQVNTDLTEWTFTLRDGAMFSDGTPVTANDVVKTLAVQWDAADPLHTGNQGNFNYWSGLFAGFMNPPAAK